MSTQYSVTILKLNILKAAITFKVDRGRNNFCVQKVKEPKSEGWKRNLWNMVDFCAEMGSVSDVHLPEYTPLIPKKEAPLTKVYVDQTHFHTRSIRDILNLRNISQN